jgi:large subunit ribosomal protein L5
VIKNTEFAKNAATEFNFMAKETQKIKDEKIIELKNQLKVANIYQVPKLEKIVINSGVGRYVSTDERKDGKPLAIIEISKILSLISGQKPKITRAQKSIASFKIRENDEIGATVTLRGKRMQDFLFKLINVTLPRTRDFRGISEKKVDVNGILTIGIKEHLAFPELIDEDFKRIYGLEITLVPNTRNREKALALYKSLNIPFAK